MKLPRTAILLLRGLEGCGVSTYARHFKAYFDENNRGKCDIFALNLSVGRPDTSTDLPITKFNFDEADELVRRVNNEYDLSLVFSVPAKNAKEEIVNNYVEKILDKIKSPKWLINHDHHYLSIGRNADFENAIKACDGVLCHSLVETKCGFIRWMKKRGIDTRVEKLETFFHIPLVGDFVTFDNTYRYKRLINASRAVAWKRSSLVLNLQKELAKRNFITEMIGFERSIAGYSQLKNYEGKLDWYVTEDFDKPVKAPSAFSNAQVNERFFDFVDDEGQDPNKMYVFGSYDHKRGLRRISQSAFATHPRSFEHNGLDYGNNHEYQGLEAALLSVPIFHRHFLETVTLPDTDVPLSAIEAFISIDDDNNHLKQGGPNVLNASDFVDRLEDIWKGNYTRYRQESFSIINTYYSSWVLIPKMLDRLGLLTP
ncbi:hypothetical protein [Cyanophage S-TIM54]|nr:hypothetical protein [Cyanophage S-TIM54]